MALLFIDGFDAQSVSQMITQGKWSSSGLSVETTVTRFGTGQSIQDASVGGNIERNVGSNLASGVLGAAFRVASGTAASNPFFILYDGSTIHLGVIRNSDGTLSICRGTSATVLGTSTATMAVDTWAYIELKFLISDSITSGDVVLYMDGVAILTLSTSTDCKNGGNSYITKYRLGGDTTFYSGSVLRRYIDDHYLIDLTGSANNAPLGSVRVQTLYPTANGNSSGMSGSDGNSVNNFQLVDETTAHTTDTDYVENATPGTKDTYGFGDTLAATSTVFGVQTNIVARKTDTDNKTICPVIRHSSTDYDGTTTANLPSTYQTFTQMYEQNPGTSAAWTKSDVDGAEFGVKVVS